MIDSELTRTIWSQSVLLNAEFLKREEKLTRGKLQDALQVPQALAQHIVWALQNVQTLQMRPEEYEATKRKALFISDIHIPYHDTLALDTVFEFAEKQGIDAIIFLGDVIDFYQISRFKKDPRKKGVSKEIEETRKFFARVRERFPKARIYYKEGNHEVRMQTYLMEQAPAIYDLVEDLYVNKVGLRDLNIRYIEDQFRYGKLWCLHGHEKPSGGNPEWVCNVMFQYVLDHFIVGHFHRNQKKDFKRINGDMLKGVAIGWMVGREGLEYAKLNKWGQGFAIVEFEESGRFRVSDHTVENGIIY